MNTPAVPRGARLHRRADRLAGREPRPVLKPGEVFITGGKHHHIEWCNAVNGVWLSGAQTLKVVPADSVSSPVCSLCWEDYE